MEGGELWWLTVLNPLGHTGKLVIQQELNTEVESTAWNSGTISVQQLGGSILCSLRTLRLSLKALHKLYIAFPNYEASFSVDGECQSHFQHTFLETSDLVFTKLLNTAAKMTLCNNDSALQKQIPTVLIVLCSQYCSNVSHFFLIFGEIEGLYNGFQKVISEAFCF